MLDTFQFIHPSKWRCERYSRGVLVSFGRTGEFRHWLRIGPREKG